MKEPLTPKQVLANIIGYKLVGNEFSMQNVFRIQMAFKEQRNKVLDEVKREVEKEMTDVETVGSFRNSVRYMIDTETFSTIISQLKLK